MNEIMTFTYQNNEVRTVDREGETWWVLKDVCEVLDIKNPTQTADRIDDDEKAMFDIGLRNGAVNCINEAGLYNVILRSDKPEAKPFRKWVTSEVLPSIRKHGAYMTPETLQAAILNPDTMIQLCTALKDEQDKRKAVELVNSRLTVDNAIMQPKAEYFDELVDRNLLTGFRETAKQLNLSPKKFIDFLLARKYVYRDQKGKLMPYQQYVDKGLFTLKESMNEKTEWSGTQTMITPKGRETFRLLFPTAA